MQVSLSQNERAVLSAMYGMAFGGPWNGEGASAVGLKKVMDRLRRKPCLFMVVLHSGLDLEAAADGIQCLQLRAMIEPVPDDHMNMVKQLARHVVVSPKGHKLGVGPLDGEWMIFWNDEPLRELTKAAWSMFALSFIRKVRITPLGVQVAEAIDTSLTGHRMPVCHDASRNTLGQLEESAKQTLSPESVSITWVPVAGYVGRKTICTHERFRKNGKNPSATTIDAWVNSAAKGGQPVVIEKDPANQENYYPETWIRERIARWNPRTSET